MINYKFKTKPYDHQLKALDKSWDKKQYGYFMEMGTGKSKVLVDNMAMLYDKGKINGALIIAPKGVYNNWFTQEIPIHLSSHIKPKMVLWTASTSKAKDKEYQSLFETGYDLHILIMNVEALSTDKGRLFAGKFLRAHRALMAIDESTTIKTPTAKRTKAIVALGKEAYYKRILTGSPVTKSPLDLFSQCYFLDPFLLNFFSYVSFRNRYAIMRRVLINGRSIQLVAGYQRIEELERSIKPFSFRVLKEDCLDLPKKLFIKHRVELTKEQRQLYDQMRTTALAELNSKVMSTSTVLTQLMRLHQITCGHMKTDNDEVIELKNNRIKDLLNLIEDIDGKVIIWANYVHDIQNIIKAISHEKDEEGNLKYGKESIVTYYGAINADKRQDNIKKFQDPNSKVRFFIGNPQTGGYGITLTEAKAVIYYSNSYDLEKRLQSEDRAHRIGQKNNVTYIDMLADDTVDEKIVESLRSKVNIATEIMGEDLREWI
mgnify:CR=1 FL=1